MITLRKIEGDDITYFNGKDFGRLSEAMIYDELESAKLAGLLVKVRYPESTIEVIDFEEDYFLSWCIYDVLGEVVRSVKLLDNRDKLIDIMETALKIPADPMILDIIKAFKTYVQQYGTGPERN